MPKGALIVVVDDVKVARQQVLDNKDIPDGNTYRGELEDNVYGARVWVGVTDAVRVLMLVDVEQVLRNAPIKYVTEETRWRSKGQRQYTTTGTDVVLVQRRAWMNEITRQLSNLASTVSSLAYGEYMDQFRISVRGGK